MESYIYNLKGGCGITEIKLNINDDKTFKIEYYCNWMGMGSSAEKKYVFKGNVVYMTSLYYMLYTTTINDESCTFKYNKRDVSRFVFNFYKFDKTFDINEHQNEYEGMFMGGCTVNGNTYKYDSLLNLLDEGAFNDHTKIPIKFNMTNKPMISEKSIDINTIDDD
jgi:hypothetical protein